MSWLEASLRVGSRGLLAVTMAAGLSACFRPLYGPTPTGHRLQDELAAIEVAPIVNALGQERSGHFLRTELVYALNGSGIEHPKKYKLAINMTESVSTPIINPTTGRADSATINLVATYTLTTIDGARTITGGTVRSSASYTRDQQRFASIRAARDAEQRDANVVSDQIRTRIATAFATQP